MTKPRTVLERFRFTAIDQYQDAVSRWDSVAEQVGLFTLFAAREGWSYGARPIADADRPVDAEDVRNVLARQSELRIQPKLEWIHELAPTLRAAAVSAGLCVEGRPLLVLDRPMADRPSSVGIRPVDRHDRDLNSVRAAISIGFEHRGTARGSASVVDRDLRALEHDRHRAHTLRLMARGRLVLFGAFDREAGAVGGGSYVPVGEVAEIVGVAVLPAHRRNGVAAALSDALATHALSAGCSTVFCTAEDDEVARIYLRAGFRRLATSCSASVT